MKRPPATARRLRLDLRTVLGLADPDLPNWSRVRAAQARDTRRMLPVIWATNLFNALVMASMLWRTMPHTHVLAWLTAMLTIIAAAMRSDRRGRSRRGGAATIMPSMLRGAVCGAIWAAAPILFGSQGGIDQQVAICLILGGMIASAPITLSGLPLSMAAFVVPVALGLAVMMARTDLLLLVLLPPIYAVSLLAGGIAVNRAALRRRWAETALEEEAGLVSLLLREFEENGADWLWQIDVRKRLIEVTPRLAQAFDQPAAALHEQPLIGQLATGWPAHGAHPPELRALLDLLDGRASFKDHLLPVMIGGDRRWWRLSAAPRYEADGSFAGFRGVGSDVTEQRRTLERMDRLARADGLTDIANRMGFTEMLRAAIDAACAGGMPCALILVDLDRFKAVNDTYGHPVGDKLLRAAAARLAGLADADDACGRLGGDEFAILVGDGRDFERIDALCRRVRRALTQPFEIDGNVLQVGASIGTALAPRDGDGVETLMRNADLALYRSKRSGRGTHHHFVPALLDGAKRHLTIERGLRHALERDELTLAYQPVVAVADGRLKGFEALLRWHHPDLGEVAPAEFLPVAAAARLMGAIGDWVLHTACCEAMGWPADIRLSINLSAAQAMDARLPMAVRAALAISGLPPARLELEIAEPALLEGGEALIGAIDRLRATGVRLVLDDFGTALACIRQSRFNAVKISREFLDDAGGREPGGIALIRALVAMADALGVTTIAKGAETRDHQALALAVGCRQMQGYASGPPLPARDALRLARIDEDARRDVA